MRPGKILVVVLFVVLALPLVPAATTPQQAAELFKANTPDFIRTYFANWKDEALLDNPLPEMTLYESHFRFADLSFQGDSNRYVLLVWGGAGSQVYWRLLRSQDGGASFSVYQDAPYLYSMVGQINVWNLRLEDLTGDGVPEVLIYEGAAHSMGALLVLQWKEAHLASITPIDQEPDSSPHLSWGGLTDVTPAFITNTHIDLDDIDGDGKAEVIVYASRELVADPGSTKENPSFSTVALSPTYVYRYDGNAYVLLKQFPGDDPYPITVPSIAVVHPGTIPLSELQAQAKAAGRAEAKGGGGNLDLQVFVSHPAGTNTVDDMDASSFVYDGTLLAFKKRWANQKQPDTTSANFEWGGCPVKQTAVQGQGEWNPAPEDPFLPAPDGKSEYHFVGPYLELRLAKSAVYPYLLAQAQEAFAKEPSRQTYFVSIPLSGKMKNGKLAAVSALVCVKATGNAKTVEGKAEPPAAAPAQPPRP